jgi:hypothetical protein
MAKTSGVVAIIALMVCIGNTCHAQGAPASSNKFWHSRAEHGLDRELAARPEVKYDLDLHREYALPELIDLTQKQPRR